MNIFNCYILQNKVKLFWSQIKPVGTIDELILVNDLLNDLTLAERNFKLEMGQNPDYSVPNEPLADAITKVENKFKFISDEVLSTVDERRKKLYVIEDIQELYTKFHTYLNQTNIYLINTVEDNEPVDFDVNNLLKRFNTLNQVRLKFYAYKRDNLIIENLNDYNQNYISRLYHEHKDFIYDLFSDLQNLNKTTSSYHIGITFPELQKFLSFDKRLDKF
jgi:hypothetical protein